MFLSVFALIGNLTVINMPLLMPDYYPDLSELSHINMPELEGFFEMFNCRPKTVEEVFFKMNNKNRYYEEFRYN